MASLGSFGVARPAPGAQTFGWFGMEVRVHPEFGETTFVEWMEEFGDVENGTARALYALSALLRGLVHPDDYDEFWSLSKANHQGSEEFSALVNDVVSAMAGRPTERSEESSSGPQPSGAESTVSFLRRVSAGRPDIEAGLMEAALARGQLTETG